VDTLRHDRDGRRERRTGVRVPPDPYAAQKKTEALTVHVLWMTSGLVFRFFRGRNLEKRFEHEPDWRHPRGELTSGYTPSW